MILAVMQTSSLCPALGQLQQTICWIFNYYLIRLVNQNKGFVAEGTACQFCLLGALADPSWIVPRFLHTVSSAEVLKP